MAQKPLSFFTGAANTTKLNVVEEVISEDKFYENLASLFTDPANLGKGTVRMEPMDIFNDFMKRGSGSEEALKAKTKGVGKAGASSSKTTLNILELIGDPAALKKLLEEGAISKLQYDDLIRQGLENPKLGKTISKSLTGTTTEVVEDATVLAAKKLGAKGMILRGLPFIGSGLDTWSAIEEFQKGNLQSGLLFSAGALTSFAAPWWSTGLSLAAIAESIRADRAKNADPNYEDPLSKYLRNVQFAPHMITPSLMDFYSVNPSGKKEQKVVLVPVNTGGGTSNSTSDGSGTNVEGVSSTDGNNDNQDTNRMEYEVIG